MKQEMPFYAVDRMAGRLGWDSALTFNKDAVPELENMANHLYQMGGRRQQDRMIRDKRRSLNKAVLYSYQGAFVRKIKEGYDTTFEDDKQEEKKQPPVRALINPDKTKQDYDDKIISIGYEHNFSPGDVFEWVNTGSKWLIYLQDKTELAYFRGEIRRCKYSINYEDENGNKHTTYAAIRGPVETRIEYIQKNGVSVDKPNYSLNILLPNNSDNLKYFTRYAEFFLQEDELRVCWRVEAVDWISTPGILQVSAVEYYTNLTEDDIDNRIVGGLKVKTENPNSNKVENYITGETFIKPGMIYEYSYTGLADKEWYIDKKYPVKYKVIDNKHIKLKWTAQHSGQFELCRGTLIKTIVVESLF